MTAKSCQCSVTLLLPFAVGRMPAPFCQLALEEHNDWFRDVSAPLTLSRKPTERASRSRSATMLLTLMDSISQFTSDLWLQSSELAVRLLLAKLASTHGATLLGLLFPTTSFCWRAAGTLALFRMQAQTVRRFLKFCKYLLRKALKSPENQKATDWMDLVSCPPIPLPFPLSAGCGCLWVKSKQ